MWETPTGRSTFGAWGDRTGLIGSTRQGSRRLGRGATRQESPASPGVVLDGLELAVFVEAFVAELPAEARTLVAAERGVGAQRPRSAVEFHLARPQPAGEFEGGA